MSSPIKLEDVMEVVKVNPEVGIYISVWWCFFLFVLLCICLQSTIWIFFFKPMLNNKIINNLKVHNKVAIEGIVGIVRKIEADTITVDIGNNTNIIIIKNQINNIKYIS